MVLPAQNHLAWKSEPLFLLLTLQLTRSGHLLHQYPPPSSMALLFYGQRCDCSNGLSLASGGTTLQY